MHYGDFIITPPMAWHDHGNETDQPMFWLDGLDIPIVQFLDASFSEHHDEDEQPIARPVGDAQARYGSNLLPVDQRAGGWGLAGVQLSVRAHARGAGAARPQPGVGSLPRPQDALQQSRSRAATRWRPSRRSSSSCRRDSRPRGTGRPTRRSSSRSKVAAGPGSARTSSSTGSRGISSSCRAGSRCVHEASDEAVLFSFSDRPVQEALQLFREDRHSA